VLATSMTDIACLRGLFPHLAQSLNVLYMHENQFAYPSKQRNDPNLIHFQITQLYSAICADILVFNSEFNRSSFLEGVESFLSKMPDAVPQQQCAVLEHKSYVLPVPLEDDCFCTERTVPSGPLQIVWNHRWEYDKAPERFFAALDLLQQWGIPFGLHVMGQQFERQPAIFEQARHQFAQHLMHWGYAPSRDAYLSQLCQCDVVVSTALHEFQGLSVLEACATGCRPLVPNRLAYPQWIPPSFRYASFPDDPKQEAYSLAKALQYCADRLASIRYEERLSLQHLRWSVCTEQFERILLR
ncbi:MAG: DUF3524 domain-containing protein, partial [Myxococcota bacterium]